MRVRWNFVVTREAKLYEARVQERPNRVQHLIYSEDNGIAFVTLNCPKTRNALSHELLDELESAMALIERTEQIRVVVLSER